MQTIRAADHAMLQPMFQVKLTEDSPAVFTPTVQATLSASQTAPPAS
jgi:branched-chain amino acid transport system substrate-binding protein